MAPSQRRVLVIGGSFAGLCVARDMATHFLVTIVDCKEFFEYTPGVLRAYVKPKHYDALSFNLHPVIEQRMGCKFIWGEVTKLDGSNQTATIKPMFSLKEEVIDFDYCIIACGCNFGPFKPMGESLWFPTVHNRGRDVSEWAQFDERFIEGRRRHILHEYNAIGALEKQTAEVLVVGAGFIGVEWVTELQHFFPKLKLTIIDFLDKPLGPLPLGGKNYCEKYMKNKGINQRYKTKKEDSEQWYKDNGFAKGKADKEYVCVGVKASNYFMPDGPDGVLSEKGPGGGGWILMDMTLAVKTRHEKKWCVDNKGYARVYAVGDCNYGCIEEKGKKPHEWPIPPIPKISYPGEEEAVIATRNVENTDHIVYGGRTTDCFGGKLEIQDMHWPWGAGMFATSLGPDKACFVVGANYMPLSGYTVVYGSICAVQKEFIEQSKTNECRMGVIGRLIWHFVHHTPLHLWGGGPRFGY